SDTQTLFEYLAKVLPNFDRDRVHAGDVKKLIRWFSFLHEHGLTQAVEEEVETTKEEEEPEA
ncbi:MAG TPA: hypothetical protein PLI34_13655, partial [Saprospiraceae bacterium]|nr:hypothetical protein [Saprospiraceae bacterium]